MKQWNKIFKKKGRVFRGVQEDIPKILTSFKRHNVKRILDLGSGSGRHAVYFSKKGFDVYGIDIAEEGIKITKDWLEKEKLHADLRVGSIYKKLPYQDNLFDAVISTNTIHHARIKNIQKAIREIERVLKPRGLIFITVRKRKFRRFYPKLTIIEKYGKQQTRHKVIEPRTYVPIEGGEKGLIHYLFTKELLKKEFKNFKIYDIWVDFNRRHYCLLGGWRLKNSNLKKSLY